MPVATPAAFPAMGWLKKKNNPLTERAQELNKEIASLEAQIARLNVKAHRGQPSTPGRPPPPPRPAPRVQIATDARHTVRPPPTEPVFEEVGPDRFAPRTDSVPSTGLYNEQGVRKFDVPGMVKRVRSQFAAPTTTNPKLVSYLAAGGIRGLQPLRKERRIARNRFILFASVLFLVLLGTLWWYLRAK